MTTTTKQEFQRITEPPNFGIDEIKKAIPQECFNRKAGKSLYYFFRDYFLIAAIYYVMIWHVEPFILHLNQPFKTLFSWIAYPLFWFMQGTLFWCLFVVGHDCGHGSFSDSKNLNNLIGHLSHTPILVPFHCWKISHSVHHANTSNVRKDESFVAVSERHYRIMWKFIKVFRYHIYPIGGWTLYLLGGMPIHYRSHFWWNESLFTKEQKSEVTQSLIWFYSFIGILYYLGRTIGFYSLSIYYFIPYMIFGAWIAIVTHLHHTHPDVPWFRNQEWNYLRGALSTVDRNYGIIEQLHHDIGTHAVHHLFTKIPHYNLKEATEAIKPILGNYYKRSEEPVWKAMLRIWKYCRFVANEGEVVFYQPDVKHPNK